MTWIIIGSLLTSFFFVSQVLTKSPPPETSKDLVRPLPSSASSTSSRTSQDADSETGGSTVLSTKKLVFIAADVDKLQGQVILIFISHSLILISFGSSEKCFNSVLRFQISLRWSRLNWRVLGSKTLQLFQVCSGVWSHFWCCTILMPFLMFSINKFHSCLMLQKPCKIPARPCPAASPHWTAEWLSI